MGIEPTTTESETDPGDTAGPSVEAAIVAKCAEEFRLALPGRAAALAAELADLVPELREDEDVFRQTVAALHGNALAIMAIYSGEMTEQAAVAPEQLLLGRTLRRRGMTLDRLVSSYRSGQNVFWSAWLDVLGRHATDKERLVRAMKASSSQLNAYVDRALEAVVREYETDRERTIGRTLARRTALVQRINRGEQVGSPDASRVLGYELSRWHTGLVVWFDPADGESQAEQLAAAATRLTASHGAFVLPIGGSSLWAWVPSLAILTRDEVRRISTGVARAGLLVSTGRCCRDIAGFRETHRQAMRAQGLMSKLPTPPALALYEDVEIVALMAQDLEHVREFVGATLGPLARATPAAARMRETLSIYLAEGANAAAAAERLHAHKNTVRYRIQRAEAELGSPVSANRLGIELALFVAEALGDQVLISAP